MIIQKGGHGSGILGHRTLGDATHNMTRAQRQMSLDRLKAEQAKRAGKPVPKPVEGKPDEITFNPKDLTARGHINVPKNISWEKQLQLAVDNLQSKNAKEMVGAVLRYSGGAYVKVREGKDKTTEKNIENFIESSPKWNGSGTLYRGIHLAKDAAKSISVGSAMDMKGLSSWSSDQKISKEIANHFPSSEKRTPVIFKLEQADTGTSISHISKYPEQKEVLLSGKTQFDVISIEGKRTLVVTLRERK